MATIIKRGDQAESAGGPACRGVAFDFHDLSGHAEEYVQSVRQAAAKIVQDAHAEAERIRDQAERAGREAAEAAIEKLLDQKVAARMRTLRPALDDLVRQMSDRRSEWLGHWEDAAVGLSARMAEKLIGGELRARPELTLAWVREALELAAGASEVTIRLNPSDHKSLGGEAERLADTLRPLAGARVEADASVAAGGCVLETAHGVIDQQVESRLARLVQDLS